MASIDLSQTTATVRQQYELLPYPPREPAEERRRLLATALDDLGSLNFHCFAGKRDYQQGFRALVAGGGTGDAVIFLAHQLKQTDAEIVYLDLSRKSQQIARARAAERGLEQNIQWINGSLLDLPQMDLSEFDYINCCGVLHHLADPAAGLRALREVLKENGALGLMLYGKQGRTGVYQLQELLKLLAVDRGETRTAIRQTEKLIADLPETNWFRRGDELFNSLQHATDETLYDMFLHSQDTGFSIPRLYELLDGEGLHLAEFTIENRILYQARFLQQYTEQKWPIESLPLREQQAAAELFWGSITTHSFWATRQPRRQVDLSGRNLVPFFSRVAEICGIRDSLLNSENSSWEFPLPQKSSVGGTLRLRVTPVVRRFFELIDAQRTMGEIAETIAADAQSYAAADEIRACCSEVIGNLLDYDLILLRDQCTPAICTW